MKSNTLKTLIHIIRKNDSILHIFPLHKNIIGLIIQLKELGSYNNDHSPLFNTSAYIANRFVQIKNVGNLGNLRNSMNIPKQHDYHNQA